MASFPTNKERTNYARLSRAIIDVCTKILQDILQRQLLTCYVKSKIRSCPDFKSAGLKSNQWAVINNAATVGSYRDFDITLVYQVLRLTCVHDVRNILKGCNVPNQILTAVQGCPALVTDPRTALNSNELTEVKHAASTGSYDEIKDTLLWKLFTHLCPNQIPNVIHPTNKWGDNPGTSDINIGDDVERIRVIRNTIYGHITTTEINDAEFSAQWGLLQNVMIRMDIYLGGHYREELDHIQNTCMDDGTEKKYCDEIEKLAANEKELEEKIQKVVGDVEKLAANEMKVHETIQNVVGDVETLAAQEKEVQEAVQKIAGDVETFAANEKEVQEKVRKVVGDVETLAANEKEVQAEMQKVVGDVAGIQTKVTDLQVSISKGASKLQDDIDRLKNEREQDKTNTSEAITECKADNEILKQNTSKSIAECKADIESIKQNTNESIMSMTELKSDVVKKMEEMKTNVKEVPKETTRQKSAVEKQTLEMIDRHREDKTFVVTKAVHKGIEVLNEHGMLIYSGLPGDGKTKNAFELLSHYKESHPDWLFLKLNDVRKWSKVDPDVNSVILLDDCLGSTNTDTGIISNGETYWSNIYACVKSGKVKVILTIRKNIFLKNLTKLEKYELFNDNHIVDLTSEDFKLDEDIKRDILLHHCRNKNIMCSDDSEDSYQFVDELDDTTPVKLSKWTVQQIAETNPVIGFPFSCYLFGCHKKYTKQGPKFFQKPTEHLIDEIKSMISTDSKYIEKVQYSIMSYMMLNGGELELNKFNLDILFEEVAKTLKLEPTPREKSDAIEQLTHRYIVKTGDNQTFEFKHQTILESVALCFYVDNAELLLKVCSKEFIKEFIRPQSYKVSEGEIVLTLKQNDYEYMVPRFTYSLQHGKDTYDIYSWWIDHPVLDDVKFVACLMDVIQSNQLYKQIVQECCNISLGMFHFACKYGTTYLIGRLYNVVDKDKVYTSDCLLDAAFEGRTDTVIWLLDHNINMEGVYYTLSRAPTDTLTSMIKHPNITINHVIKSLGVISERCDNKTVEVIFKRWPDIEQTCVLRLLYDFCKYGYHKAIDVILKERPDIITQQNMTEAFSWACIGGCIDTVEYLLNIKHTGINCKILHLSKNDEKLTNLHIAACFGRFKLFIRLTELGLCVTDRTKSGCSVLNLAILGYACQDIDIDIGKGIIKSASVVLAQYYTHIRASIGRLSDYRQVLSQLLYHKDIDLTDIDMDIDEYDNTLAHYCVVKNDIPMIELLFSTYKKSVYSKNSENITPVHTAAFLGRYDMMKKLIELGLCVTDRTYSGFSVLNLAILGYIKPDILNSKSSALERYYIFLQRISPFHLSIDYRQIFSYLLHHKDIDLTDIDMEIDEHGSTLSHYCVIYGDVSIIELLYNTYRKSVFSQSNEKITCIHIAAFKVEFDMMNKLIDLGLCVKDRTESGLSLLNLAILGYAYQVMYKFNFANKVPDVIKSKSAVLEHYHPKRRFLQLCAVLSDCRQVFSYLLHNDDVDLTDIDMEIDEHCNTLSHYCVIHDDVPIMELLYNTYKESVYSKNIENMTCVHTAAFLGRFDMMNKLIELGLCVKGRTESSLSVLNLAILGYAYMGMCMDMGIYDNEVPNIIKSKSAVLACYHKSRFCEIIGASSNLYVLYRQVFSYLLHHKDIDLTDIDMEIDGHGSTLSHFCVIQNDVPMIELLFNTYKESVYSKNSENMTCVHIAAFLGRYDVLNKLIELGLCVTDITYSCLSVLDLAILGYACRRVYGSDNVLDIIKGKSAVLADYCTQRNFSFLFGALSEYRQVLSYLLHHEVMDLTDINIEIDEHGNTLSHYCVIYNDVPVVELLYNTAESLFIIKRVKT